MADRKSRLYKLTKMEIETIGEENYDIRDIVMDFSYYESIDCPFIRCDFTILDSVDFNKTLMGGELIHVKIDTNSSGDQPLNVKLRVHKIGSIIKSERGQLYIIHCVSPEMYNNEMEKVFKAFGPGKSTKDVDNIPQHICKKYLKAPNKKCKDENFEHHSKVTFISPNWRPVDVISYMSDKVTRVDGKGSGKASKMQAGFLFFENRYGFQFKSIDLLCMGGGAPSGADLFEYTYVQQGSDPPANGAYVIESITYPDKANHLRNMRMGTFKTSTIAISLANLSRSHMTNTGKSGKNAPAGTNYKGREITYKQIFQRANTIHKELPFDVPEDLSAATSTRIKYRIQPSLKNQPAIGNDPNNGTKADTSNLAAAEYASGRYSLLQAVQLTISVPGNTALTAGQLVKVKIPASRESGKNVKVDLKYSGKYLIQGLTHVFTKEGITTNLVLTRDSIMKTTY